jgi:3-hydroxyisobutyrate dehydrogenase-like beta-hydroxyacid dehydrogenase
VEVGFIGLGIMGSRQAANLRRAGHELTVFNRTREKADQWAAEHGGHVADSPREVAERVTS